MSMDFYKHLRRGLLLGVSLTAAGVSPAFAQGPADSDEAEWYVGIGAGMNFSQLQYSELDKELYPDNNFNFSGVFSVFAEYDFGRSRCFAVRPQLSFLTRGGKLSNIGRGYFANYDYPETDPDKLEDVVYQLKATYFDIRIPLIYQIGPASWRVRPYAYVAPVLGFVTGGHVNARQEFADGVVEGVRYELSKANMSALRFAAAVGIGAKWQIMINDAPFFIGADLSYEFGVTDTYSSREKDGDVNGISFFPAASRVYGSRRLSGFEAALTFGVPFSAFRKKAPEPPVVQVIQEPVRPAPVAPAKVEKQCYTLDEIIDLMTKGQSVAGKTICAIDDVNFEFGKSSITPSSNQYLQKLAETLKRTNANICVKGHTDNVGTEEFNLELSRQRALEVLRYLRNYGVDESKLSYEYYGMSRPLTSNDTEDGRRLNRRVEFEILK